MLGGMLPGLIEATVVVVVVGKRERERENA